MYTESDRVEKHEIRAEGSILGEWRKGIEMSGRWLRSAIAVHLQAPAFNFSSYSLNIENTENKLNIMSWKMIFVRASDFVMQQYADGTKTRGSTTIRRNMIMGKYHF